MNFVINCETVYRLSRLFDYYPSGKPDYFKNIRIESKNNKQFAIVTNIKVAAIEIIGNYQNPDGAVNLTIDPVLIEQCKMEAGFKSQLFGTYNEALQFVSVKTTMGYNYPGNAGVFHKGMTVYDDWRDWLPDELPTQSSGTMMLQSESISALGLTAPSKQLLFPTFINDRLPVLVRDSVDDTWIGVFMPEYIDGETGKAVDLDPIEIPEWVK